MTIGLDLQAIRAAVFARLVTDAAGAAARAMLGDSAAMTAITGRTLAACDVSQVSRVQAARIPPIWAALDQGPATGRSRVDMRVIPFDWWLYDTPEQGGYQLAAFVPLIDALYGNVQLASGRIAVDLITVPTYVQALGMLSQRVRLSFTIWR